MHRNPWFVPLEERPTGVRLTKPPPSWVIQGVAFHAFNLKLQAEPVKFWAFLTVGQFEIVARGC